MPLYKPTELNAFLSELGITPKKSLSQNFLIDANIIKKIALSAELSPGDLVVEIGAGPGALTEELLAREATVIAIECDKALAGALPRLSQRPGDLYVYCGDVLQLPLEAIVTSHLAAGGRAKIVANLPYHLTGAIVQKLVTNHLLYESLTLMVQKEVARRYIAKPNSSDYSSFTIFLQVYSTLRYAFTVPRSCFYPAPNVDSAVVNLKLHTPKEISNLKEFFTLTRTAFSQRRKMLRSSLRALYSSIKIEEALMGLGISRQARPQELTLEQFYALYDALQLKI